MRNMHGQPFGCLLYTSKKIHLKNMRIYASGENLLTFDHLKIADPEATDDKQFQYPLQMIFNIGLNLNF